MRAPPTSRTAPGGGPSPVRRRLLSTLWLLGLAAAAGLVTGFPFSARAPVYPAGEVAPENVKAQRDFTVPDEDATLARQRAAVDAVPDVFDLDPGALEEALEAAAAALNVDPPSPVGPEGPVVPDWGEAAQELGRRLGIEVSPEAARTVLEAGTRRRVLERVRGLLRPLFQRGVAAAPEALTPAGRPRVIRDLGTREERALTPWTLPLSLDEARIALAPEEAQGMERVARAVAGHVLRPNVTRNADETARRRDEARKSVAPVRYLIRSGEMIVREGDRVSPEQERRLRTHAELVGTGVGTRRALGLVALWALGIWIPFEYGRRNVKKFRSDPRDRVLLGGLVLLLAFLERGWLAVAAGAGVPGGVAAASLAVPLAAGALTVRAVLNSETAVIFAVPLSLLGALATPAPLQAALVHLTGALVGAHGVGRAGRRAAYLRAGMWAGLAQAAVAGAYALLGTEPWAQAGWAAAWGLAGGLSAGALSLLLVFLAEAVLGYTTDLRLTELSSLDHPLLRDLMLRAPGTYHHSLVTGSLAKAGAEAIGARALLATVAAYYHDIGKISKPSYYIENQAAGRNPHDRLSPRLSSLILTSHVKEGVELARRHRLGREIEAILQQHHGTGLIRYFHEKAARRENGEVREADYRYPGPKPQTREAGLVLLADAVEAASRTLPDLRPARIQGMVQNIINRTFADGQLDECDLTLRDLHRIAGAFSRILTGIHHQRIDYPLLAHKERRAHGDLDPKRSAGSRDRRGEAAQPAEERLKRLGL
ncbi:HDIG domain-containing protein [Deferrisoma palaeochoriense]